MSEAAYSELARDGTLKERVAQATELLRCCTLCPNECKVDREHHERGRCRSEATPLISSYNVHYGEEPPLVGTHGSGTIFFTNCTMRCVYCQNYPISQLGQGKAYPVVRLARMFLKLQDYGCHNINFVTPTHFVPQILQALEMAVDKGFHLPLVYNTSGYESLATLKLLDGIIDIYLPDIRYSDNAHAQSYSKVDNYVDHNRVALKEMYRQVGLLDCDEYGVARRGMIIRHLVLPENRAGSEEALEFLANELSPRLHVALMRQYFPAYNASEHPPLDRKITNREYEPLVDLYKHLGFNGWIQTA
jgi:putative pyruvate formate lyase activating enzyme